MTVDGMPAIEKRLPIASEVETELDLLGVVTILWRYKTLVFSFTTLAAIVALAISLALPKIYAADATILPTAGGDVGSSIAAGLASQLGAAAGALGGFGGFGSNRTADLVEILSSRSMTERVISHEHLDLKLKSWKTHGDLVTKVMHMTTVIAPTLKDKAVVIRIEAPNPQLAADMANAYVSQLKDMLDEIGYNSASKNRKFLESQLKKNREDLARSENELTEFQSKNHLASLPDTILASIKSISDLEAGRISTKVQLQTTDEAIGLVKSKINLLQADPSTVNDLEIKRKGLETQEAALAQEQQKFLGKLSTLPPKAMDLARLQRDVQVQNAIYLALNQQYEAAVIDENKDSDAFLPLDKAEVPDYPAKPKKFPIIVTGLVLGFVVGAFAALTKNFLAEKGVRA